MEGIGQAVVGDLIGLAAILDIGIFVAVVGGNSQEACLGLGHNLYSPVQEEARIQIVDGAAQENVEVLIAGCSCSCLRTGHTSCRRGCRAGASAVGAAGCHGQNHCRTHRKGCQVFEFPFHFFIAPFMVGYEFRKNQEHPPDFLRFLITELYHAIDTSALMHLFI